MTENTNPVSFEQFKKFWEATKEYDAIEKGLEEITIFTEWSFVPEMIDTFLNVMGVPEDDEVKDKIFTMWYLDSEEDSLEEGDEEVGSADDTDSSDNVSVNSVEELYEEILKLVVK